MGAGNLRFPAPLFFKNFSKFFGGGGGVYLLNRVHVCRKVTHNTLYTCCILLVFEKFSPMMVRHQLVTGVASEPQHERRFPCSSIFL